MVKCKLIGFILQDEDHHKPEQSANDLVQSINQKFKVR
jgi:hypothetical protein